MNDNDYVANVTMKELDDLCKEFYDNASKILQMGKGTYYRPPSSYISIFLAMLKYMDIQDSMFQGKKILEPGCGPGYFLYVLKKFGANVIGIDINKKAVKIGKKYNLDLRERRVEDICQDFEPESFDAIISNKLLERNMIPDKDDILNQLYTLTKGSGIGVHETIEPCIFSEKDFEDVGFDVLPTEKSILGETVNIIAVKKH